MIKIINEIHDQTAGPALNIEKIKGRLRHAKNFRIPGEKYINHVLKQRNFKSPQFCGIEDFRKLPCPKRGLNVPYLPDQKLVHGKFNVVVPQSIGRQLFVISDNQYFLPTAGRPLKFINGEERL